MRVLVDATAPGDGGAGGIGTYVRSLLGELAGRDDLDVVALAGPGAPPAPGLEVAPAPASRPGRLGFHLGVAGRALAARRVRRDVLHEPGLLPPVGCRGPWVQTLHDVIPLTSTDPALAALRARMRAHAPWFRRAAAVVAVSRHSADAGIAHLGLDPARIEVVHHGVSATFTPDGCAADPTGGVPYVLVVGEYQARKGWDDAVAVVADLAERGYPHRLVLAGRVAPDRRAEVDALVHRAPPGRVVLAGFVADLPSLHRGADLVLSPSRAEGFGLPALEAMACGRPLLAYDNSAVGEVVGDGGLLVPDGDVAALAAATVAVLTDERRADELAAAGRARAAGFTWAASAAAHAELYRSVAAR